MARTDLCNTPMRSVIDLFTDVCTTSAPAPSTTPASGAGQTAPAPAPSGPAAGGWFGDVFEVLKKAGGGAGTTGGTTAVQNTNASGGAVAQPVPEPSRTAVVPSSTWEDGNGKSKWKDKTDPSKITTTTDPKGDVKVVKFDSNLVIDDDGTKKNVVGLKFYEAEVAKQKKELKAANPKMSDKDIDAQAKSNAKEAAKKEAEKKTKDTGEKWTVDVDYQSTIASINGKQLDANKIPFIALPEQIRNLSNPPIKHGDLVAVSYNGKTVYAIYGDGGPAWKSGEGSPALAKKLGLGGGYNDAEAEKAGKYVTFTVLPGTRNQLGTKPLTYDSVQAAGAAAFAQAQKDGNIAP
ncbi:MAG: glycoside hydrolase family 75 protein [Myxococcota bacterium]